jgi:hypothetical protein
MDGCIHYELSVSPLLFPFSVDPPQISAPCLDIEHGECNECKQDRQCTCNITLRHIHVTIVAMEKQSVVHICVCACSIAYPAYNSYAPYFVIICGSSGATIFFNIVS